ncbi:hypothetical protein SADUNF_Sadunf01G0003000 [Salix dunnii]|uniref:Uncharacterized protein n=1 Tax=Salix dunnii TaxID=1413687 RepID=A0A835N9I8_9ROSI|nr:hypothetical protein SADUNF_Sadunf01G0003000 [Salix dunnii]
MLSHLLLQTSSVPQFKVKKDGLANPRGRSVQKMHNSTISRPQMNGSNLSSVLILDCITSEDIWFELLVPEETATEASQNASIRVAHISADVWQQIACIRFQDRVSSPQLLDLVCCFPLQQLGRFALFVWTFLCLPPPDSFLSSYAYHSTSSDDEDHHQYGHQQQQTSSSSSSADVEYYYYDSD